MGLEQWAQVEEAVSEVETLVFNSCAAQLLNVNWVTDTERSEIWTIALKL